MIYLSAQPSSSYFAWQLEVQIENFKSKGITKDEIHVLLSFSTDEPIDPKIIDLVERKSRSANFFFYEDTRKSKEYTSSIRPHIIKKHFRRYTELKYENIFYHDSDIVFTQELPDFEKLSLDCFWYVSDARFYLDYNYLNTRDPSIFKKMCEILSIDEELVLKNDNQSGGAQYLLKNVDYTFWNNLEKDCENLFKFLKKANPKNDPAKVPSWCADMWAILYNGFKRGQIRIAQELDFCWPHNHISQWNQNKIFHNAGVQYFQYKDLFFKGDYLSADPFKQKIHINDKQTCSQKYLDLIEQLNSNEKYYANDITFVLTWVDQKSTSVLNPTHLLTLLLNNFETTILFLDTGDRQHINSELLDKQVIYDYRHSNEIDSINSWINSSIKKNVKSKYIFFLEFSSIIYPSLINNAIINLRFSKSYVAYPFNRSIGVDQKLFSTFSGNLDFNQFKQQENKAFDDINYENERCFIIRTDDFKKIGLFSIAINDFHLTTLEFYFRLKVFGKKINFSEGYIYKLLNTFNNPSNYIALSVNKSDFSAFLATTNRR